MDMKEKLVELLDNFNRDLSPFAGNEKLVVVDDNIEQAEYLIASGVTVQEWISVKDRLPDENVRVLVCFRFTDYSKIEMDTDRIEKGLWYRWSKYVTHWQPLPEPPKGE